MQKIQNAIQNKSAIQNTIESDTIDESDDCSSIDEFLTGHLVQIHPVKIDGGLIKLGSRPFYVGRAEPCELIIDDASVSRKHAKFYQRDGSYWLEDLESTNGTIVNRDRIKDKELISGDRIKIGGKIFKFIATDEIEAQYHEAIYATMTKDGLTGAWNKQYFMDVLQREIARRKRSKGTFGLLMMDLDHFKLINDTYSHLVGDEVLIEMSRRIFDVVRTDDVFARYGGEEFSIILTDANHETGLLVAKRCLAAISGKPFETTAGPIDCTASIGMAIIDQQSKYTRTELLKAADDNLYKAKNAGRNQIQY